METIELESKSYTHYSSSGYHMICDIKEIQNQEILNSVVLLKKMLDIICDKYQYTVLKKSEHVFEPQGCTILYMLSESHISIHTFPEKNYLAFDIYTCRPQLDNTVYENIYDFIIETLNAKRENPIILNRSFH